MIAIKNKKVFILILAICCTITFIYKKTDNIKSDVVYVKTTSEAFEEIDSHLMAINTEVNKEFSKLPRYERPAKNQPIIDALEFAKFSKTIFTDTMSQNADILNEINNFDKEAEKILRGKD